MTVLEAEAYRQAVLVSGRAWLSGDSGITSVQELVILCDFANVSVPSYVSKFVNSANPSDLTCTGAHKGLFKLLGRLEKGLLKKYGIKA